MCVSRWTKRFRYSTFSVQGMQKQNDVVQNTSRQKKRAHKFVTLKERLGGGKTATGTTRANRGGPLIIPDKHYMQGRSLLLSLILMVRSRFAYQTQSRVEHGTSNMCTGNGFLCKGEILEKALVWMRYNPAKVASVLWLSANGRALEYPFAFSYNYKGILAGKFRGGGVNVTHILVQYSVHKKKKKTAINDTCKE